VTTVITGVRGSRVRVWYVVCGCCGWRWMAMGAVLVEHGRRVRSSWHAVGMSVVLGRGVWND
jgi:hypothetical protein